MNFGTNLEYQLQRIADLQERQTIAQEHSAAALEKLAKLLESVTRQTPGGKNVLRISE